MNSPNNSAAPSRLSKWLRRLLWTFITLVSLLVVYYQWENRRSARELVEARAQMIAVIGTDKVSDIIPPQLTDESNFFALPAIAAWKTNATHHQVPENAFWPKNLLKPELIENGDGSGSRVDWAKWAANRDLKGETAAQALHRELGITRDLVQKLAAGLERPFSCLKPTQRDALDAADGDFISMAIPNIPGLNDRHRELALHLRAAAHAGDSAQTQTLARILLRLFPESCATHGTLVGSLVSIATHEIAFEALQDALACPVWDERGLTLLQAQLARENDLAVTRRALTLDMLWGHAQMLRTRQNMAGWKSSFILDGITSENSWFVTVCMLAPIGWRDADTAHHIRCWLQIIGPDEETAWKDGTERFQNVQRSVVTPPLFACLGIADPRRIITSVLVPNIGNVHAAAAGTLFHRRCLILACELEKHRLRQGEYPAALPVVAGFETHDPARPKHPPAYRFEKNGYVLTSAHDGWTWRMKRNP